MRLDAKPVFSMDTLVSMTEVFGEANNLRRWTDFTSDPRYDELAKQALNCAAAFVIAKHCEYNGWKIDYTKFPRIALGRIFAKVSVYYDTPEHKINEICAIGGFGKEILDVAVKEQIVKRTSGEFSDFVWEDRNSREVLIYRSATKVATYLELLELSEHYDSLEKKLSELQQDLYDFVNVPGVKQVSNPNSVEFKFLRGISRLRNANRWAARPYLVACSVLGHLFDTACFGYAMSLLRGESEEEAAKMFWLGIFHDIAETWTKDIPSPVKKIIPGLRDATEEYERRMLDEHVYSQIPGWLSDAIKAVSMEDESNERLKLQAKEADYISADSECVRNLMAGSRDWYWINAITGDTVKRVFVTPEAEALHNRIANYALQCGQYMPKL